MSTGVTEFSVGTKVMMCFPLIVCLPVIGSEVAVFGSVGGGRSYCG